MTISRRNLFKRAVGISAVAVASSPIIAQTVKPSLPVGIEKAVLHYYIVDQGIISESLFSSVDVTKMTADILIGQQLSLNKQSTILRSVAVTQIMGQSVFAPSEGDLSINATNNKIMVYSDNSWVSAMPSEKPSPVVAYEAKLYDPLDTYHLDTFLKEYNELVK